MNLSNYKTLGVINRTPNSFSDHGASLDPDYFKFQLKSFLDDAEVIPDIGFESTAPMNQAISDGDEIERFFSFLELSKKFSFEGRFISFDTYKIKNFLSMVEEFQKIHPLAYFIFNDVSGILDEELKQALLKFRGKNFYYIYTFSHIPNRAQVLNHMNFLRPDVEVVNSTKDAFKRAYDWFKSFKMESQLVLDPGFGFSKTYEQNWQLIERFGELDLEVLEDVPVLIGLSKKSFLKKALELQCESQAGNSLEELHKKCIFQIQKASKRNLLRNLLFRVHDPSIMKSL